MITLHHVIIVSKYTSQNLIAESLCSNKATVAVILMFENDCVFLSSTSP